MQYWCQHGSPGPIVTPIWDGMGLPKETVDEWTKQIATEVPMKRFGQREEVASTVAFFASQDASQITGVESGWGTRADLKYFYPRKF